MLGRYGEDVQVLMVNYQETYETAAGFAAESGIESPVLLDDGEHYSHYAQAAGFGYAPFPLHVVVDQEGVITYLARQYDSSALFDALDQTLE